MNDLEKYEMGKIIDSHLLQFVKKVEQALGLLKILEKRIEQLEHLQTLHIKKDDN